MKEHARGPRNKYSINITSVASKKMYILIQKLIKILLLIVFLANISFML